MSNAYQVGQILYEAEATHGELVNTYATLNFPVIGAVDCSGLKQAMIDSQRVQPYLQGGTQWLTGPMDGSVKTKFYIPGHGSSTAAATTLTAFETLLGIVFGNASVSSAAGTTATAGTATALTTAASGTFAAGSLCKVGVLGDARGNGQFYPIASHIATAMTLLAAMEAAPTAADVIYSAAMVYPSELAANGNVQPIRLQLLTANLVYNCHGCYPLSVTFSGTNFGEFLQVEVEWGVSYFSETAAVTFPNTTVPTALLQGGPNAGGSIFVNDVGTPARVKRTARNFSITYKLGVEKLEGPGSPNPFATCIGSRRTGADISISWTEDADAQTANAVLVGFATAKVAKHVCATFTTAVGSSVGFYFPNVVVSERPVQMKDSSGNINRLRFTGQAYTGPTNTNDLTMSAARIALA